MKATMPEPVAVVCHGYDLFFMGGGPIADLVKRLDVKVGDWLITTTQAEAYADAVRREALEEAASVAKQISDKYAYGYYGNEVDTADEIEAAIRALIPPQQ